MADNAMVFKIPVYHPGGNRICLWVTRREARQYVHEGAGDWGSRCASVILKRHDDMPVVNDQSCRMGPRIIEAVADGKKWAEALADGWKPVFA